MEADRETLLESALVQRFAALCERADAPPDAVAFLQGHPQASADERREILLLDQSRRWPAGSGLAVEEYLAALPDLRNDAARVIALVAHEFRLRHKIGETP